MSRASQQRDIALTVVIPYRDADRTLAMCLKSLARQTLPSNRFEVIVVDDGSVNTRAQEVVGKLKLPMHTQVITLEHNQGQAAATNKGVERARGQYVLLTCADIELDPRCLEIHLNTHAQESAAIGVMGYIPYHPRVKMTLFMEFLWSSGIQFAFHHFNDEDDINPKFLYAPNFSIEKKEFDKVHGFDEQFVFGWQDTDLGLRLGANNIRMVYRKDAIAHHDHPVTFEKFLKREHKAGELLVPFLEKYKDIIQGDLNAQQSNALYLLNLLPQLEILIEKTKQVEAHCAALEVVSSEHRKTLYELYSLCFQIIRIQGALTQKSRFLKLVGLSDAQLPTAPTPQAA